MRKYFNLFKLLFLFDNSKKINNYVWQMMKKWHLQEKLHSGVYEEVKTIRTLFTFSESLEAMFEYRVVDQKLEFCSTVINAFDEERASEIFILAAHFNNILKSGKVIIDTRSNSLFFVFINYSILYSLYPSQLQEDTVNHYNISRDVCWAFNKLIIENEEPAIIIADLLKSKEGSNPDK